MRKQEPQFLVYLHQVNALVVFMVEIALEEMLLLILKYLAQFQEIVLLNLLRKQNI